MSKKFSRSQSSATETETSDFCLQKITAEIIGDRPVFLARRPTFMVY
ncbi:MAG TPA: hypothetical protein VJ441_01540 [Dehalococcoidia bacterium]|nr:hypothetical protein [Dehalococcoidia bacterium]